MDNDELQGIADEVKDAIESIETSYAREISGTLTINGVEVWPNFIPKEKEEELEELEDDDDEGEPGSNQ